MAVNEAIDKQQVKLDVLKAKILAEKKPAKDDKPRNEDNLEWQGKVGEMEMLLAQRSRMIEESIIEIGRLKQQTASLIDALAEDYGCSDEEIQALLVID